MDRERWPAGGPDRRRIDTHISSVVLAGDKAYKIKKPLDLGFLNFTRLDDRRVACEEELRLNRRLAPQIYEAMCAITGHLDRPSFDGEGPTIDWAVRMRRFDPDAVLSNPAIPLDSALIDRLAEIVARFHARLGSSGAPAAAGSADQVTEPIRENLKRIRASNATSVVSSPLARVEAWTSGALNALRAKFDQRLADGHVRECHGDLHLGNIALIDGQPVVFDAIEFDAGLRWIDTASDLAFLTMDLHHRDCSALAWRLVDRYLQECGDFGALAVLQLYEVYRAMVRAKVAAIRLSQDLADRAAVQAECCAYVELADRLSRPRSPALIITHGVSGSGKSVIAAQLPDQLPAVRLRSDVERKRLLGIDQNEDAAARDGYAQAMTDKTYTRLAELADQVIAAGYIAVVDATFLDAAERRRFAGLASAHQVPFVIIDCDAPVAVLRERIAQRRARPDNVSDAGLDVLEAQRRGRDPLDQTERARSVGVTPDRGPDVERLRAMISTDAGQRA